MQKETVTKTRKKITTDIIKAADMKTGEKVEGVYKGFTERPWLDKADGEEKMIPQFAFERADKSRFLLMGDAGLKNAIFNSGVKEGDDIEIVKLDKVDLGGGKRVNQYEIFQ